MNADIKQGSVTVGCLAFEADVERCEVVGMVMRFDGLYGLML